MVAAGREAVDAARRAFTADRVVAEYGAALRKAAGLQREGPDQSKVRKWHIERNTRTAGLVPKVIAVGRRRIVHRGE